MKKAREARKSLEEREKKKGKSEPDPTAQYNFTDPDSRIIRESGNKGAFIQGYYAQEAVDAESQIMVSTLLTQTNPLDPPKKRTLLSENWLCYGLLGGPMTIPAWLQPPPTPPPPPPPVSAPLVIDLTGVNARSHGMRLAVAVIAGFSLVLAESVSWSIVYGAWLRRGNPVFVGDWPAALYNVGFPAVVVGAYLVFVVYAFLRPRPVRITATTLGVTLAWGSGRSREFSWRDLGSRWRLVQRGPSSRPDLTSFLGRGFMRQIALPDGYPGVIADLAAAGGCRVEARPFLGGPGAVWTVTPTRPA